MDLGPEGSDKDSEVVAKERPEHVASEWRSYTGGYLKELLVKSSRTEAKSPIGRKKRASAASMREREAAE